MKYTKELPKQPSRFISYWNVAKLLYGALFLFLIETVYYFIKFEEAYRRQELYIIAFWLWSLMFSFIHVFLVIMDGWSRFQNYKRIKDHLFEHGFTSKMASRYVGSKCQRMALSVAARELGMEKEVLSYYDELGIRWYHFIPRFMIKDPLFPFKNFFWSRTFLEKYYKPKYDYRFFKAFPIKC